MLKKGINYIVGLQRWTIINHADRLASKLICIFQYCNILTVVITILKKIIYLRFHFFKI